LLRTLPGIEFSANGGAGTNSSVFIRGANATQPFNKQYELVQYYNTPDRNFFISFDYHPK